MIHLSKYFLLDIEQYVSYVRGKKKPRSQSIQANKIIKGTRYHIMPPNPSLHSRRKRIGAQKERRREVACKYTPKL